MTEYNYLVVSDFHVSLGMVNQGHPAYHPREDFFYDDAFARFLEWADANRRDNKAWELIFNGDCLDFWPIDQRLLELLSAEIETQQPTSKGSQVAVPPANSAEQQWIRGYVEQLAPPEQEYLKGLESLGETTTRASLDDSLSKAAIEMIIAGHPRFFEALAWWLAKGHRIVFLPGNHDLDLVLPEVQAVIREQLARVGRENVTQWRNQATNKLFPANPATNPTQFQAQLSFECNWFYYKPNLFYIEHGSQYESANSAFDVINPLTKDRQLETSFGKHLVVELLSPLEDRYPHLENRGSYLRFLYNLVVNDFSRIFLPIVRHFLTFIRAFWQPFPDFGDKTDPIKYACGTDLDGETLTCLQAAQSRPLLHRPIVRWLLRFAPAIGIIIAILFGVLVYVTGTQLTKELNQNIRGPSQLSGLGTWFWGVFSLAVTIFRGSQLSATVLRVIIRLGGTGFLRDVFGRIASLLPQSGNTSSARCNHALVSEFDIDAYLYNAATTLHHIFATHTTNNQAPRYYIMGHDHRPDFREIPDFAEHNEPRAFYVNTGAWLPQLDTDNARRLRSGGSDVEFTCFMLWGAGQAQLVKWNDAAGRVDMQIVPPQSQLLDDYVISTAIGGILIGLIVGLLLANIAPDQFRYPLIGSLIIGAIAGLIIGWLRERRRK